MRIAELAMSAGYSLDQARRRLNRLVELDAIERERDPQWPRAWNYGEEALQTLTAVKDLEASGMTSKEAIQSVADRHHHGAAEAPSPVPPREPEEIRVPAGLKAEHGSRETTFTFSFSIFSFSMSIACSTQDRWT